MLALLAQEDAALVAACDMDPARLTVTAQAYAFLHGVL